MPAPRTLKVRPLGVSLARFTSALAISAAIVGAARGATVFWDNDATVLGNSRSGVGLGGTGVWDTTAANWWDGDITDQIWNNAALDTAVFGGTAGLVTLTTPNINVGNLIFSTTGYTIAQDATTNTRTLTLGGGAVTNPIINLSDRTGVGLNTTISAKLVGTNGLTFNGNNGTLTLNYTGTQALTGDLRIRSGTVLVKANNTTLASTMGLTFNGTGSFVYDNENATATKSQTLGTLAFNSGDGTIRAERTEDFDINVTFAGVSRAAGATGMIVANSNVAAFGANVAIKAGGLPAGVVTFQPGIFSKSNVFTTGFGVYDSSNGFRPLNYALDSSEFIGGSAVVAAGTNFVTFVANRHYQITGSQSAVATETIGSLNINNTATSAITLTQSAGATLTIGGGGAASVGSILKIGGGSGATISGGTVTSGGNAEMVIRTDAANDTLTIASIIGSTTGALTKAGDGTLTLTGTQSFTGTTYVNGGKLSIVGGSAFGAGTGLVISGGTYDVQNNGDGTVTPQTIATGKNVTVNGLGTISVGRVAPVSTSAAAAFKTITFGTLSIGNETLTAAPASYSAPNQTGAYTIQFTGGAGFTDALPPTFVVTGSQPTSATAGLTIAGSITGATGFIKRGTGTLALTDNTSTFGGAGATIEIQEGLLSFSANNALGNANTAVVLNTLTSTEGLAATGGATLSSGAARKLILAGTNNSLETATTTTLSWDGVVSGVAGVGLVKRGPGRLVLNNTGNTFGGAGTVIDLQSGILEIPAVGALGNAANVVQLNTAGASDAFRANATMTVGQNVVLAQTSNRIEVPTSGTNTNVLTLGGVVSSLNLGTNTTPLIKAGAGDLVLTNPANTFGGVAGSLIDIQGGSFTVNSAGALGSPNNSLRLAQNGTTEKFVGDGTAIVRQNFTLAQPTTTAAIFEVTPGNTFTLSGTITSGTSAVDLFKRGTGTLELTNPANTFGGTSRVIDIQAGILAAASDTSLGAAANTVRLNAPAGQGFRALATFSTSRTFNLSNTDTAVGNLIDVVPNADLTLGAAFTFTNATNALVKANAGRLVLNAANSSWNGNITINGGAIRATSATSLGSATGTTTINNTGGLELNGAGTSFNEPLFINTPGDNTSMVGPNSAGVLRGVLASTSTYNATIQIAGTATDNTSRTVAFGVDSGATLNLVPTSNIVINNGSGSATNRTFNLLLAGDGTGTLGSQINKGLSGGTVRLIKAGASQWTLNPTGPFAVDALEVRNGLLVDAASANANGEVIPNTTSLTFNGTGTFRYDNSGVSGTNTKTETLAGLAFTAGEGTVELRRITTQNLFMSFGATAPSRSPGATGLFNATNASVYGTSARFTFTGTSNGFMDPGLYASLAGASSFAEYDTASSSVRQLVYSTGTSATTFTVAGGASPLVTGKHMQTTGAINAQGSANIASLSISGGVNVQLNSSTAAQTLTINSGTAGGLLKTGGGTSLISTNGTNTASLTAGGNAELIIRADAAGDTLNIALPITNTTGALTKSGLGILNLTSSSNAWTGATYVNGGTLGIQGAGALAGSSTLALNSGAVSLGLDGDNKSSLESIPVAKDVTVGSSSGTSTGFTVGRSGSSTTALNKTVTLGALSIGYATLSTTANNQYGLRFSGATTLTDALPTTFAVTVATSQASNLVSGLTLDGRITSTNGVGFIKTGTGALVLGNNLPTGSGSANSFGGAGAVIDIQGGFVAAGSNEALGNVNNAILLNTNGTTTGFRAIGTFATDRIFTLGQTSNAIDVTQGNVLTLNQPLNLAAMANALTKNDNGVLELGADNPVSWTGAVSINAGAIRLKTAAALGPVSHSIILGTTVGTALQLSGSNVIYNAYVLPNLQSTGINSGGALENVSGSNTWAGAITLTGAATIGSTSGTLTLTGGFAGTTPATLTLAGAGDINFANAPVAATIAFTKVGAGTATLGVNSLSTSNPLTVGGGTFQVKGSGAAMAATGTNNATITVTSGATLRVDDSVGSPVTSRLGGRTISLTAANFRYDGNAANSAETVGALTLSAGQSSIVTQPAAGKTLTLTIPSLTLNADTALAFTGNGLGTPEHRVLFSTQPALTNGISPRLTVNGADFATYIPQQTVGTQTTAGSNIVVVGVAVNSTRQLTVGQIISGNSNIPAGARITQIIDGTTIMISVNATGGGPPVSTTFSETGIAAFNSAAYQDAPDINTAVAADTVIVNAATTTTNLTASRTFNALKISGTGLGVALQPVASLTSSLTLGTGAVLVTGGSNSISVPILAVGATQAILHTDAGSTLTLGSTLTGTAGLVKADPGLLILNSPSSALAGISGNTTLTGTYNVNAGTVKFGTASGVNPNLFAAGAAVRVGPGATLDLNGNLQLTGPLLTDAAMAGTGGALGQVTSSAGNATLVVNQDNALRNWSANLTGPVSFSRSGLNSGTNTFSIFSPQTYTGSTQLTAGITLLRDGGAITGTSAIDLNYATLTLENKLANGSAADSPNRINDSAAINLRGATLNYSGREQTASTETLGVVSVAQGYSLVGVTAGGTGVNSAELTLTNLLHPAGSAGTVNFNAALGTIGSAPRVRISAFEPAPALTNKIIGAWAIQQADFATYNPGLGVGALGGAGFSAYDGTSIPAAAQPTQNIKISAASIALPAVPDYRLNSLNWASSATGPLTFTLQGNVLNLVSGGLLKSGNFANTIGGATVDFGRLTAGGSAASGTNDLYVFNQGSGTNTLTFNSRVIDTATAISVGTANVRLVVNSSGGTTVIANPNNSYTGGTVLNAGTLTLNGATPSGPNTTAGQAEIPAGGLTINAGTVTMATNAGQIHPNNVVTLNGTGVLNLIGNNTLAGLAFGNNGGTTAPTVNTFTANTAGGTLSIGASGVTASSSNISTTAAIVGKIDLGAVQRPFAIDAITFNGQQVNPAAATLTVQGIANSAGGITKTGNGALQFNAQATFTGAVDVNAGGIQYGATNAGSRFAPVTLAAGTRLNLANVSTTIGSLAGGGIVTNSAGTQTLTTGFNDTNTVFSGQIRRFTDGTPAGINVTKIGSGKLEFTGAGSNSTGVLAVLGGEVNYHDAATSTFGTYTVATKGTLALDNGGASGTSNVNYRLGGSATTAFGTLNMNGGALNVTGNGAVNTDENLANVTVASGSSTITFLPNPARILTVSVGTAFTAQQAGGTLLLRGLNSADPFNYGLPGYIPSPGDVFLDAGSAAFNASALAGNGAVTTELPVRADIIGDTRQNGPGIGFVTKDPFTGLLRVLDTGSETANFLPDGAQTQTNYEFAGLQGIKENTTAFSMVFQDAAGVLGTASASHGRLSPNGTVLTLTNSSGGVLAAEDATTTLSVPLMQSTGNLPLIFHVLGNGGNLTVTSNLNSGTGGITKSGSGVMTLGGRSYGTGATTVNDGTLVLDGPMENSIAVASGATASTLTALNVNGGTLDMNGTNQTFGALTNNNANANAGGTITNTSATPATLTTATAAATTFSGVIANPGTATLNFVKAGAGVLTLTSPSTFTGTTTLRGGGITLRDRGSLLTTSAIDLNYGTLFLDQQGLNPAATLNPQRLNPAVPITMRGAVITLTAGGSMDASATLDSIISDSGANAISVGAVQSAGSTSTLTLGNISRTAGEWSTMNFAPAVGGTLGNPGLNNPHLFLSKVDTIAVNPANKILGPWAVVNGGDYATVKGAAAPFEVGALGNTTGGFQGYDSTNITTATATQNVNDGTLQLLSTAGTKVINTLRTAVGTAATLSLGTNVTLTLGNGASGGILTNNTVTYAIQPSTGATGTKLTSGGGDLYAYINQNTTTFAVPVVDGTVPMNLVKSGAGTLSLTAANTYTGKTIVNQGFLSLATPSADGGGRVAVPGDLIINNATVTLVTSQQLLITAQVTLNGGATLNMGTAPNASVNTIGSLVFDNQGGLIAPTVNTGNQLTLDDANAITATNHSHALTPTVAGSELTFLNPAATITTDGPAANSLVLNAPIHTTAGSIIKAGAGAVVMNPTLGAISTTTNVTLGTENQIQLQGGATTSAMKVGMAVTGTGIPANSYIVEIVNGTVVKINQNATAAATNNLTYFGSTVGDAFKVDAGTMVFGQSSLIDAGVIKSGPVGVGTLTLDNGASIMSDGTIRTIHNPVQVNGDFTFGTPAGSTTTALAGAGVILAGTVNLSAGAHSIAVNSEVNTSTINGKIVGSGSALTKTGPGTLVLNNAMNSWGPSLFITDGVLRQGTTGAVPSGLDLTVTTGGALDLNALDVSVKTLSGGGIVTNSSGVLPSTLYVGGTSPADTTTNATSTFSGSISGTLNQFGTLGLTKVGTGVFTLSGNSRYGGQTNVNTGTLRIAPGATVTINEAFNINNGSLAEIYGTLAVSLSSGVVQTSGSGSTIRGSGTVDVITTIGPGGNVQPILGAGNTHLSFDEELTMANGSSLLYQTIRPTGGTRADGGSIHLGVDGGDVSLISNGIWNLRITNINIQNPALYTFVLFDGDDQTGKFLNGNTQFSDTVGNFQIDWGTTDWSLGPGGGIHYDFANNDIILTGVVPEPGSAALLLGGGAMALGLQRFPPPPRA